MKVDIINIETIFEPVEIEYPIYCYFQDEGINETFIKITETLICEMEKTLTSIKLQTTQFNGKQLAKVYYENQTTKEHYEDALLNLNNYVKNF